MSEVNPDLASVALQLQTIERDLKEALDRWEPPTAREAMIQLARVVAVLTEAFPEPKPDPDLYVGLTS